jgi:predicted RNA-binding Zn-ribbon protein involved in translation (DUF1610 family)
MIKQIRCFSCSETIKVDMNKLNYECPSCWYQGRIDQMWKGMKKIRYSGRPK